MKHENLESYFNSKVPSLKAFPAKKTNGELKRSSIRDLAEVAMFVQRLVWFKGVWIHIAFELNCLLVSVGTLEIHNVRPSCPHNANVGNVIKLST